MTPDGASESQVHRGLTNFRPHAMGAFASAGTWSSQRLSAGHGPELQAGRPGGAQIASDRRSQRARVNVNACVPHPRGTWSTRDDMVRNSERGRVRRPFGRAPRSPSAAGSAPPGARFPKPREIHSCLNAFEMPYPMPAMKIGSAT